MKNISKMKKSILIYLLIIPVAAVYSQTDKQLVPSDLKQQTIVTEPVTLRKGFLRIGTLLNYRVADKYFTDSGGKEYYMSSTWGSKAAYNLTLQYGVSDRFQVDLVTEYMIMRQESQSTEIIAATNTTRVTVARQKGLGIGDTHVSFRYQFLTESKYKVSLTGGLNVTVPTGEKNPRNIKSANQYDLPVGDGTYATGFGLSARSIAYPYSFTGWLRYTYNFTGTKIFNAGDPEEKRFRFGNLFEAGSGVNLHLNEWIVMANEINYYHEGQGKIDGIVSDRMPASWAASYEPGLVFQVKRFRLGESVKIPLKGRNVPADPLYIVMIQYIF